VFDSPCGFIHAIAIAAVFILVARMLKTETQTLPDFDSMFSVGGFQFCFERRPVSSNFSVFCFSVFHARFQDFPSLFSPHANIIYAPPKRPGKNYDRRNPRVPKRKLFIDFLSLN